MEATTCKQFNSLVYAQWRRQLASSLPSVFNGYIRKAEVRPDQIPCDKNRISYITLVQLGRKEEILTRKKEGGQCSRRTKNEQGASSLVLQRNWRLSKAYGQGPQTEWGQEGSGKKGATLESGSMKHWKGPLFSPQILGRARGCLGLSELWAELHPRLLAPDKLKSHGLRKAEFY